MERSARPRPSRSSGAGAGTVASPVAARPDGSRCGGPAGADHRYAGAWLAPSARPLIACALAWTGVTAVTAGAAAPQHTVTVDAGQTGSVDRRSRTARPPGPRGRRPDPAGQTGSAPVTFTWARSSRSPPSADAPASPSRPAAVRRTERRQASTPWPPTSQRGGRRPPLRWAGGRSVPVPRRAGAPSSARRGLASGGAAIYPVVCRDRPRPHPIEAYDQDRPGIRPGIRPRVSGAVWWGTPGSPAGWRSRQSAGVDGAAALHACGQPGSPCAPPSYPASGRWRCSSGWTSQRWRAVRWRSTEPPPRLRRSALTVWVVPWRPRCPGVAAPAWPRPSVTCWTRWCRASFGTWLRTRRPVRTSGLWYGDTEQGVVSAAGRRAGAQHDRHPDDRLDAWSVDDGADPGGRRPRRARRGSRRSGGASGHRRDLVRRRRRGRRIPSRRTGRAGRRLGEAVAVLEPALARAVERRPCPTPPSASPS